VNVLKCEKGVYTEYLTLPFDRPPQASSGLLQRDVGQEHQRLFSEAANDHQPQRLVEAGKSDGADAELQTQTAGFLSLLFDDGFQIKHRTALSDFQVVESAALIDQIPAFAQADEEPAFRFYQGKKQFIPVAAPVHDPDPFSLGIMADRLDRC